MPSNGARLPRRVETTQPTPNVYLDEANQGLAARTRTDYTALVAPQYRYHPRPNFAPIRLPSGVLIEPQTPGELSSLAGLAKRMRIITIQGQGAGATNQRTTSHTSPITGPALLIDVTLISNIGLSVTPHLDIRVSDDNEDDGTSSSALGAAVSGTLIHEGDTRFASVGTGAGDSGLFTVMASAAGLAAYVQPLGVYVNKQRFFIKHTVKREASATWHGIYRVLEGASPEDAGF